MTAGIIILVVAAVVAAAVPFAPLRTRSVAEHPGLHTWLGSALRRSLRRPADPGADRRVGVVLLLGVAGLIVHALVALGAIAVWLAIDVTRRRRRAADREVAVRRELPEVIELLALALGAGGSIHLAVGQVGARPLGPVSAAMARVGRRVAGGARLAPALEEVVSQLGPPVRPLVRALVGAEYYGTTIVTTLDRLAAEARADRRRHAQQAARRAPVKLLFPLVLTVLPAFVLLTVVPTLAGTFDGLRATGP